MLALCGVWLLREASSGGFRDVEEPSGAEHGDWIGFAWVSAGLLLNAALITTLGFIQLRTVLRARGARLQARGGQARPGCSGSARRRGHRSHDLGAGVLDVHEAAGDQFAGPHGDGVDLMDILNQLLQGFATAATPVNLLWALLGCTSAPRWECCPASGRPRRWRCCCRSRWRSRRRPDDLRAGIYYGAMYVVRPPDPAQHAGRVGVDGDRDGRELDGYDGRAGAALATPRSVPSSPVRSPPC